MNQARSRMGRDPPVRDGVHVCQTAAASEQFTLPLDADLLF